MKRLDTGFWVYDETTYLNYLSFGLCGKTLHNILVWCTFLVYLSSYKYNEKCTNFCPNPNKKGLGIIWIFFQGWKCNVPKSFFFVQFSNSTNWWEIFKNIWSGSISNRHQTRFFYSSIFVHQFGLYFCAQIFIHR